VPPFDAAGPVGKARLVFQGFEVAPENGLSFALFEWSFGQLAGTLGKVLFPHIVAKRDAYAKAGSEGIPVWRMKGQARARRARRSAPPSPTSKPACS